MLNPIKEDYYIAKAAARRQKLHDVPFVYKINFNDHVMTWNEDQFSLRLYHCIKSTLYSKYFMFHGSPDLTLKGNAKDDRGYIKRLQMMTNLILNLQTTVMLQYYIDVAMINKVMKQIYIT